ncbi:MAG TPA: SCO family protein [Verrucomicrobiae bacterium]|nr:SCO family protein [Verrucomicrobiae bacterium]
MNKPTPALEWIVWGGLGLVILGVFGAFLFSESGRRRLSSGTLPPILGTLPDFVLTNQTGSVVSLNDLRGQVWVADIIFTRCPGPCEKMTRQMAELQAALPGDQPVKLISLTTDPDFDSPAVLQRYAERFGAQPGRWWFLTGAKHELMRLAVDGLKLAAVEKKPEERENPADLFIHATIFVVVDRQGGLRGVFETQTEEYDEAGRLRTDIDPRANWTTTQARIVALVNQLLNERQP